MARGQRTTGTRIMPTSTYTGSRVRVTCANCHEVTLRAASEAAVMPFFCSDMCRETFDGSTAQSRLPGNEQKPVRVAGPVQPPAPRPAPTAQADELSCPYCGAKVKAKRIASHKMNRCPSRPMYRGPAEPVVWTTSSPPSAIIPSKGKAAQPLVPATMRLAREAAPGPGARLHSPPKGASGPVSTDSRRTRERYAEVNSIDTMDATRGWGEGFREVGRYGSTPSYDNYGDESEP